MIPHGPCKAPYKLDLIGSCHIVVMQYPIEPTVREDPYSFIFMAYGLDNVD